MASQETVTQGHKKTALSLIIAAVVLDLAFDLVKGNGPRMFWFAWTGHNFTPPVYNAQGELEWDGKLYLSTYIYDFCAHLSIICRALAVWLYPMRRLFLIMAGFEFLDMLDYGITHNSTWVTLDRIIPDYPIDLEFGFFKSIAVIGFTIREFYGVSSGIR